MVERDSKVGAEAEVPSLEEQEHAGRLQSFAEDVEEFEEVQDFEEVGDFDTVQDT